VNCQEVAKNHSSVPSNLNKDISVLYLSCNHITLDKNDKEILCQYNNLSELYLNNNCIVLVSNYSFEKLLQLKILDVSSNHIATVEKAAFAGLNELQILNLQNNKITQLNSDVFAGLNKLKVLNLQNIFLKDFDIKVTFNSICIKLSGNAWTCSCDLLLSLQRWLNNSTMITVIQPIGKSWTFLMGVLAVILSTTALIMAAIKFPTWYRYLISYSHRRLQEKEESELFEETFTPQLCMPPQTSETNEEEPIVIFEQFRPYVPEDDGFIEDKYIDP
ncbi:Leucine-rich repeat-containing protein 19, partial [Ophiophagus hannah]